MDRILTISKHGSYQSFLKLRSLWGGKFLFNGLPKVAQLRPWVEVLDFLPVRRRHKLRKVPGDDSVAAISPIVQLAVVAQVPPHLVRVLPVDLAFSEHGERGIVALSGELLNLCIRARFLPPELIAGEGKDLETLLSILRVEICQLSVVVRREASLRGHIDKHDHFFIRNQVTNFDQLTVYIDDFDVLERASTLSQLLLATLENYLRENTPHLNLIFL